MNKQLNDPRTIDDLWDEEVDEWSNKMHAQGVEAALIDQLKKQASKVLDMARDEAAEIAGRIASKVTSKYWLDGLAHHSPVQVEYHKDLDINARGTAMDAVRKEFHISAAVRDKYYPAACQAHKGDTSC